MAFAHHVDGSRRFDLKQSDPADTNEMTMEQAEARLEKLTAELRELQALVFAAESHGVLVVLQGMDAAGKDVTIGNVFALANPESCRVKHFSAETPDEEAHDFLWRSHAHVPKLGELVIFDRSYYEQVIADKVLDKVPDDVIARRYAHINAFERLLIDDGSTILFKFFLHVSHAEQGERLAERESNLETAWKISVNDWKARDAWDDYMGAYEEMVNACSTKEAPWDVIPSDHQWFHNLAIAETLVERLRPYRNEWLKARDARGAEERKESRKLRGEQQRR